MSIGVGVFSSSLLFLSLLPALREVTFILFISQIIVLTLWEILKGYVIRSPYKLHLYETILAQKETLLGYSTNEFEAKLLTTTTKKEYSFSSFKDLQKELVNVLDEKPTLYYQALAYELTRHKQALYGIRVDLHKDSKPIKNEIITKDDNDLFALYSGYHINNKHKVDINTFLKITPILKDAKYYIKTYTQESYTRIYPEINQIPRSAELSLNIITMPYINQLNKYANRQLYLIILGKDIELKYTFYIQESSSYNAKKETTKTTLSMDHFKQIALSDEELQSLKD